MLWTKEKDNEWIIDAKDLFEEQKKVQDPVCKRVESLLNPDSLDYNFTIAKEFMWRILGDCKLNKENISRLGSRKFSLSQFIIEILPYAESVDMEQLRPYLHREQFDDLWMKRTYIREVLKNPTDLMECLRSIQTSINVLRSDNSVNDDRLLKDYAILGANSIIQEQMKPNAIFVGER